MDSSIIEKYFEDLTPVQKEQFARLGELYPDWNSKINVISRKDIDNLYPNHILHSLAIAKFLGEPADNTRFLDLGTGGGFPGIPLAILMPQCTFHLIDRIGKKIKVAQAVASAIGLTNVTFQHGDAGECHDKFDYVVSRAVMPLKDLVKIVRPNISAKNRNRYANGLICLKGGDLAEELSQASMSVIDEPVSVWFDEPFFEGKCLVYVPFN